MGRTYFNSGLDTMMANKYQEPLYFADIHFDDEDYGEGTLSVVRTTHASNRKFTRDISSETILRLIVKGLKTLLDIGDGIVALEASASYISECNELEALNVTRFYSERDLDQDEAIIVLLRLEYENFEPKATIITTIKKPSIGLFKTDGMMVTLQ